MFDVAIHPTHPFPSLAVSGGEDDMAYIFDTSTGQEVVKLTGHTDSVVAVAFSMLLAVSFFKPVVYIDGALRFNLGRLRWTVCGYGRNGRPSEGMEKGWNGGMEQLGILDQP